MTETDDRRWQTVLDRRPGDFFLGVRTTGIFCRPGCPARTPKRENVAFYDRAQDAAAAGFRPCLKCQPLGADPATETAVTLARAIEADPSHRWSGPELAEAAGTGERIARRRFADVLGLTPAAFRDAVRQRIYRGALRDGATATEAGYDAGYGGSAARHEGTKALGMTANTYARGAPGEAVWHTLTRTSLGTLIVAATEKGVCLCKLADDEEEARAALQAEFPEARHAAADDTMPLAAWTAAISAFLDEGAPRPDLPLDLRGTAFQLRVWQALRKIPPGETPTYGQMAARLGNPKASRAVGSANGKNPVALVVPCHLVVASGGKLGGYAGGLDRKRQLLAIEARLAAK